jgi:hypothetical protein
LSLLFAYGISNPSLFAYGAIDISDLSLLFPYGAIDISDLSLFPNEDFDILDLILFAYGATCFSDMSVFLSLALVF